MTRIKDAGTTATSAATDDYLLLDGATNGSRKILAGNLVPLSWVKLASITATGSETAFDFTSIPTGYKHLRLVGTARLGAAISTNLYCKINASSTGYSTRTTYNDGTISSSSDTSADGLSIGNISGTDATASYFSSWDWIFYDYLSTAHFKTANGQNQYRNSGGATVISNSSGTWASTSAITRLTIQRATASAFVSGSTFDLYGIT